MFTGEDSGGRMGFAGELAQALVRRGRHEDAAKAFELAVAEEPTVLEWHLGRARVLLSLGRNTEAIPAYVAATRIAPARADLLNELGLLEVHPARAEEAFRAAIAAQPASAVYRANLATALLDQWRLEEAEDSLREAVALEPENLLYPTDLGHLLLDMSRFSDAEELFRHSLWSVQHGAVTSGRAWHLYAKREFDGADAVFGRRVPTRQDDHIAWSYRGMGVALLALGQNREAIVAFRGAISVAPHDPAFHQELANALAVAGRRGAAEAAMVRADSLRDACLSDTQRPPTRRPITLSR